MSSLFRVCLPLMFLVIAIGCNPDAGSTVVDDPGSSRAELIKTDLQMIVDNGEMGSEMMSVQNNLEALKADDAAKAEELLTDLQGLEGLSGEELKTKAQAMIDKL